MVTDPRGHTARQLFRSVTMIEAVPDLRRETYFLDGPLANADKRGREIKALRPVATEALRHGINLEDLMKRLATHSQKLEKFRASLEHLHEIRGEEGPRARPTQAKGKAELKAGSNQP